MKDYFFNIKRSNEIFFKNQIIENKDLIGYTELFPLKENDLIEIYIKDKKIVEFEILKTNQISKFINNNFFIKFLLLSLIVCIFGYFILSNVYINSNFKNIENMFDRINKNK
ncbi:hypothetical protein, partial [Streptobacillus moniliformis]